MQIRFSPESVNDLERLYVFIAEHDPDSARNVVLNLKSSIRRFSSYPELGWALDEIKGVREFVFGRYVVRYMLKPEAVYVLRIWHSREYR